MLSLVSVQLPARLSVSDQLSDPAAGVGLVEGCICAASAEHFDGPGQLQLGYSLGLAIVFDRSPLAAKATGWLCMQTIRLKRTESGQIFAQ